ncbi:helix-turn-helix domain-containing protein [Weissella confusa]|uniref:helix-turn-helix domain-containing protein n=1 Tax=Weissella confusa TaxID=1583 RepID=UPI0022FF30D3|nr:XRE family transcriptional regulator [Weissella confusa]MDA5457569.1 Transcriptional regulator, XRE family [Weissella confusa]
MFNGQRLKSARIFRHLSITALSEQIGVTKQMISKYEKQGAQPTEDKVDAIVSKLKFPKDYFFGEDDDWLAKGESRTFYRSRTTTTQAEKKPAEFIKDVVNLLFDYLDNYVDMPTLDEDIPNRLEGMNPHQAALGLRSIWGIGDAPISDVVALMEVHGFAIADISIKSEKIDAISGYAGDGKRYVVLYDSSFASYFRLQFSIAHELGHWILHSNTYDPYDLNSLEYKEMEKEANDFASEFLMPADSFGVEAESYSKSDIVEIISLKKRWEVSLGAIIYRMRELGIISDVKYVALQKQISYKGWRKNEPLDSSPEYPVQKPMILHEAFDMLLDADIVVDPTHLAESIYIKTGVDLPIDVLSMVTGFAIAKLEGNDSSLDFTPFKITLKRNEK